MGWSFRFRALVAPMLAGASLGFAGSAVVVQDPRIAREGFYARFDHIDENGALAGFDVDTRKALCAEMGKTCEIVQNDCHALIPGLNANECDAIIASMSITAERETQVAFTLPYYSNMLTFVGKKDLGLSASRDGLTGKSVGALRSTVSSEHLQENYADIVTIKLFDTQDDALDALVAGELDLVLGDNLPFYAWLQTDTGKDHAFVGEFIDINDRISIAIRHDEFDLLDELNEALITII